MNQFGQVWTNLDKLGLGLAWITLNQFWEAGKEIFQNILDESEKNLKKTYKNILEDKDVKNEREKKSDYQVLEAKNGKRNLKHLTLN